MSNIRPISSTTTTVVTKQVSSKKKKRSSRRKPAIKLGTRVQRSIQMSPVSIGTGARPYSRIFTQNGVTHVSFCELFEVLNDVTKTNALNWALPITPTKWTGTRTAQLTSTYSSYRPLQVRWTWVPGVPTSDNSMSAIGTTHDGVPFPTDASESQASVCSRVAALNGGKMFTTWTTCSSSVDLKTCLRANNFPTFDTNFDDIPFWFVQCHTKPGAPKHESLGMIAISGVFALHNPITPSKSHSTFLRKTIELKNELSPVRATRGIFVSDSFAAQEGDYLTMVCLQPLRNIDMEVISAPMEPIMARIVKREGHTFTFDLDPVYAAATALFAIFSAAAKPYTRWTD